MKILYAIRSVTHFAANEPIINHLCANGNIVEALFDPIWSHGRPDAAAKDGLVKISGLTYGWSLRRQNLWELLLIGSRELLAYSSYLNRKDQSEFYKKRWEGYLLPPIRVVVRYFKPARWLVATRCVQSLLRYFESLAPPEASIVRWLKKHRPDVVVASPVNLRYSPEVEYLKAAKILGIPTVIPVFSWDNLTTKGLYHITPDIVLAWNQTQRQEVSSIHRVPEEHIVITGAPIFDRWLASDSLGISRQSFCRKVGLDPKLPFFVYLGSSANVATDETWLVQEIIASLRCRSNPNIKNVQILLRPHPNHAQHYGQINDKLTVIWPPGGALPEIEEDLADFYNTLKHGICAAGINNSAMLEAVINDKPCLAILTDRYRTTQLETGHFQSLLDFDMLEITRSAMECADRIELILNGYDSKKKARRRFVKEFIRPRGLERPAGELAAQAIELTALQKPRKDIDKELDNHPDSEPVHEA